MAASPTTRTLERLRAAGYIAEVVEKWNSFTRTRKDLFGCIDVIAVGNGETIAVQTTSASNVSARVKKITDAPQLPYMRDAGWKIVVDGWRKNAKGRWECRTVDIS